MILQLLVLLAAPAPQAGDWFVETRRMLPEGKPSTNPEVVLPGDVDGDGWVDVLWLGDGLGALSWNQGYGLFEDGSAALPRLVTDTRTGELADFDGDGDLDVFLGDESSTARVYENQGGVFVDALSLDTGEAWDLGSATGDVEGDGDVDLVVASHSTPGTRLYRSGGGGISLALDPAATPTWAPPADDVALGDLDGDGDLDVVIGSVLWNDGAGGFLDGDFVGLGEMGPSLSLGDADGDGDLDVYRSIGPSPPPFSHVDGLDLNDGTGEFTHASLPAAIDSEDHVLADLDGDGVVDVVALADGQALALRGLGGATFADVTDAWIPHVPYLALDDLAAADLDGDQDLDLVLDEGPRLWLNRAGVFGEVQSSLPAGGALDVAVGDVDADGREDLLLAASPPRLLLQRPGALWEDGSAGLASTPVVNLHPQALLADLDGDGDLDAALSHCLEVPATILTNAGTGTFPEKVGALPASSEWAWGLSAGDVDGDGDADLALSTGAVFAYVVRVMANDGAAGFSELQKPDIGPGVFNLRKPVLTDVELDGDLDLLVPGSFQGVPFATKLLLGDGAGGFVDATTAQLPSVSAVGLAAGDVDSDGFSDVVCATKGELLLLNDGTGRFAAGLGLPVSNDWARGVALDDLDGDGDLDVVATYSSHGHVYAGDGTGAFLQASELPPSSAWNSALSALATFDVDGDGDLDLVSGDLPRLFIQVHGGQVAWRSVPRVGKPLRMETFGPAGTPWALAASPEQAEIALPPFGVLLLDPEHLWVAGAGMLPAEGVAATDVAVPASPALIGATMFWQALAGSPPALTNREWTVLTGF